jgi:hypothetical protein
MDIRLRTLLRKYNSTRDPLDAAAYLNALLRIEADPEPIYGYIVIFEMDMWGGSEASELFGGLTVHLRHEDALKEAVMRIAEDPHWDYPEEWMQEFDDELNANNIVAAWNILQENDYTHHHEIHKVKIS